MRKPSTLVIYEMANNHMGDVDHAKRMIDRYADISCLYGDVFDFAWKFQFRDLETFIHKDYVGKDDHKYVKRFSETRLSAEQFQELKEYAENRNFLTMCTGFDEPSVDLIESMGFDILKVASCSFTDWPLLNRIANSDKPIILSTAGSTFDDIDRVVSFLEHREKSFSLMHCVGEYPTKHSNLQLNQITALKNRYPSIEVGYSTHESPTEVRAIQLAIAKGATIVEKHVALETSEYKPNAYSVTPEQMADWLASAYAAIEMCGETEFRLEASEKELSDLRQFKRGVFLKRDISQGESISPDDVYCAWPNEDGQLLASDLSKYNEFVSTRNLSADSALHSDGLEINNTRGKVWDIVQEVKEFLNSSNVIFPKHADLEISHHYGLENFKDTGISMITVVNREYCKKLIIVLANQTHPEQYHLKKEETFVVLHGKLELKLSKLNHVPNSWDEIETTTHSMTAGDIITIEPEVRHEFFSEEGCILEEVSSTHYVDDSYYTDPAIAENKNRKTFVSYWN